MRTKLALASTAALIALAASGCYATTSVGVRHGTWVDVTPPVPYVEVVPPAPASSYAWVSGYWWWNGSGWVWVRGHWAAPPAPGYVWIRAGWIYVDGRYQFVHGRWAPPSRRVRVDYVHPQPRVRVERGVRYRTERPDRVRVRVRPPSR